MCVYDQRDICVLAQFEADVPSSSGIILCQARDESLSYYWLDEWLARGTLQEEFPSLFIMAQLQIAGTVGGILLWRLPCQT